MPIKNCRKCESMTFGQVARYFSCSTEHIRCNQYFSPGTFSDQLTDDQGPRTVFCLLSFHARKVLNKSPQSSYFFSCTEMDCRDYFYLQSMYTWTLSSFRSIGFMCSLSSWQFPERDWEYCMQSMSAWVASRSRRQQELCRMLCWRNYSDFGIDIRFRLRL